MYPNIVTANTDPVTGRISLVAGGTDAGFVQTPMSNLFGILGDSRSASSFVNVSNNVAFTHDWAPMANAKAGSPFKLAYMGGVSGDTLTQMLARVPDAISSGIGVCAVLGGTNDSWTTQAGVDASVLVAIQIYEKLRAAGIYVIALSELPNTTKGNTWHDLAQYFNSKIQAYWVGRAGGEYLDVWQTLVVGSTGIGTAAYFHDGLHQNGAGAWQMSTPLAAVMRRLRSGPRNPLVASVRDYFVTNALSNQYVVNPLMQGTGGSIGTGSGNTPTGYQAPSTATCAYSVVARSDGCGNDLRVSCTATAGQNVLVYQSLDHTKFVEGSRWVMDCEVIIESCTNMQELNVSVTSDKWSFRDLSAIQNSGFITLASAQTLTLTSPEFTVASGMAPASYVYIGLNAKFPAGEAGAVVVRMGRASVRKL